MFFFVWVKMWTGTCATYNKNMSLEIIYLHTTGLMDTSTILGFFFNLRPLPWLAAQDGRADFKLRFHYLDLTPHSCTSPVPYIFTGMKGSRSLTFSTKGHHKNKCLRLLFKDPQLLVSPTMTEKCCEVCSHLLHFPNIFI